MNPFAGQTLDVPVQLSATSHGPAEGRHVVVAAANPSAGHAPDVPVQLSGTSHGPVEGRHSVVAGKKASTQWPAPSQESVQEPIGSQGPSLEVPMQIVVAGWNPSAGHALDVPVQLSATSH